jgi:cell wall assembly regulator SMI1
MAVGYRRQASAASEVDVARLEQRIGRALPSSYRSYLLTQDGGRLVDNSEAVKEIFGIGPETPDWANLWDKLDVFRDRVPVWLLPVAQDEYGNLYAISLRDPDAGSVWLWDHEEEADEGEPPSEDNITQLAPDWATFLNQLSPPPDEEA